MRRKEPTRVVLLRPVAYIDTLACRLAQELDKAILRDLERRCGKTPDQRRGQPFRGAPFLLTLHQPSASAIMLLAEISEQQRTVINRIDVCVDLITPERNTAHELQRHLDCVLIQRWRGKKTLNQVEGTRYGDRKPWSTQAWTSYCPEASKVADEPCAHFEFRIKGSPLVKGAKLNHVRDLLSFDPMAFLRQKLIFETYDAGTLGRLFLGKPKAKKPEPLVVGERVLWHDRFVRVGELLIRGALTDMEAGAGFDRPSTQALKDAYSKLPWYRKGSPMKRVTLEEVLGATL